MKKISYLLLFFLLSVPVRPAAPRIWTVYFKNIKGMQVPLYCEVAETEKEKRRGLMFRDHLEENECMIFVYEEPIIFSFWMKNTLIPLSISFVDSALKVTEIFDMKPHDESILTSTLPGIYAIEVNKGWYRKNFIYPGSQLKIIHKDMRN